MKNQITFLVLFFCASILFCCKEKKRYLISESSQTSTIPASKQTQPISQADTTVVDVITIKQPQNGTSLEELFSKRDQFSEKSIIVKGKVTKINNGIMDRNWVHISDGTQFEGKKSLTITTQASVNIGDIVTFKGTVILNKDFGYGYIYDIVLEEGELLEQTNSD